MTPLNREQKELIFDYCMGLTSHEQNAEAEALISSSEEAKEIQSRFQTILAPLNSIEPEPCPDALAERTLWRLNSVANSSRDRLQQLLAGEQTRAVTSTTWHWVSFVKRLATAAVFMIAGSILFTSLGYLRYNSRLQACKMQQGSIFQGLSNYISDHDGQRPAVATTAGAPWWKVGYQGNENHSNTRNIYLLVKGDYVKLSDFVCPGSKLGRLLEATPSQIRAYKDFPDRRCITYSFQIYCNRADNGKLLCRKVLMADWNPIFEGLPEDFSEQLNLRLNKQLLTLNSSNHTYFGKRRGQNVLFGDGHIEFLRTRYIGISTDDIFTLNHTDIYQGCEVPSCETDFFLAP